MDILRYLQNLTFARQILWAYFVWYLIVATRYFDPSISIWLNALGMSVFVGFALYLNLLVAQSKPGFWQAARCFITPFCVSSFSALVKGRGFILIFSPEPTIDFLGLCVIALLAGIAWIARRFPN